MILSMTDRSSGGRASQPRTAVVAVVTAVFAVHAGVILLVRSYGWDDGAITLAFARTYASSGRIALTPSSEEVEGFSSYAWFALMSLAAKAGATEFDNIIRVSQFSTAAFSALGAGLFTVAANRYMSTVGASILGAAIFIAAPFLNESMNGMEMSALSVVALALFIVFSRDTDSATSQTWHTVAFVLGIAATTVRYEAVAYVVASSAAVWLFGQHRAAAVWTTAGAMVGFATLTAWRLAHFGALTPNTISAKNWAPYTSDGIKGALRSRLITIFEPYAPLLLAAIIFVAIAFWSTRNPSKSALMHHLRSSSVIFGLTYFTTVYIANIGIGNNWGYVARMQLSALPIMALSFVALASSQKMHWSKPKTAAIGLATVLGSLPFLQWENVGYAMGREATGDIAITPNEYRLTGNAVSRIGEELKLDEIVFLTPDIGGSSLAEPTLTILDLGLLANSELARTGFSDIDGYLQKKRPDVIEVHSIWAQISKIYTSPTFLESYVPVVSEDTWLWVRSDHATALEGEVTSIDATRSVRYRGHPNDEQFLSNAQYIPIQMK